MLVPFAGPLCDSDGIPGCARTRVRWAWGHMKWRRVLPMRVASRRQSALVCFATILFSIRAPARVYKVGPGEEVTRISTVADLLEAGDTVIVTGDISDAFRLTRHGTSDRPVTIKGRTEVRDGRTVRPKISVSGDAIIIAGRWNILDGVEVTPMALENRPRYGVKIAADNVVLRNCRFSYNMEAVTSSIRSGNAILEFCEFDSNGAHYRGFHTVDLFSCKPGSLVTVQHCYFHDGTGGVLLKSHAPLTLVRYNWFENSFYSALAVVDLESTLARTLDEQWQSALHPLHADILGNVFNMGSSPGSRYSVLRLGGEHETAAGPEGDFSIAHNLFVLTHGNENERAVSILVHGNVDRVRIYNNVILENGVAGSKLFERGNVWETERTERFRKARGHGEPVVEGSCNWVSLRTQSIPDRLTNTLSGRRPMFADLLNLNFRPVARSPLAGAGTWPLPMGRIAKLVPKYEPMRQIPPDLKPTERQKTIPPAIGPFEVVLESRGDAQAP